MYFTMNQRLPDQQRTKRSYFRKEWIIRFLATPLFAIAIANITPLVSNRTDPVLDLLVNYAYFTIVSHCLWVGNGLLLRKLRRSNYWINKPVIKTFSIFSLHLFLSFFLSFLLFYIWNIAVAATPLPVHK